MTTHVAESSITIEDAVYVVDTGKELTDRYNPDTMSRSLKKKIYLSQQQLKEEEEQVEQCLVYVIIYIQNKNLIHLFHFQNLISKKLIYQLKF